MPTSAHNATVDPPIVDGQEPPVDAVVLPPVDAEPVAATVVSAYPVQPYPVQPLSAGPMDGLPASTDNSLDQQPVAKRRSLLNKLAWHWPATSAGNIWNFASLMILLAVVAAVPIVQLASLGYLLCAAANLSAGRSWSTALPGLHLAGRIATFAMWAALLWLPVLLVTDLSYSVQLLRPETDQSALWRAGAFVIALGWLAWVSWAAMRGGRWWNFLWPAPMKFIKQIWRPSTWNKAADDLWLLFQRTQFVKLWWLGLRAATGALIWLIIPVSLMIIGLRAEEFKLNALIGLIGAMSLTLVMLYLPFLQILMAERNRFSEIFNVRQVRKRFRHAPFAMGLSLIFLLALSIPLYLLRIEATPEQLTWLPSLFFVGMMFPAKIAMGAAMGYGQRRTKPRNFVMRWSSRLLCVAAALTYVGALYIAQFIAWQGVYVMYFQHAVLVPVAS